MLKAERPQIFNEKDFLESANDSARHFRTIYVVYLILLFYTAVTILSTDHELLFRDIGKQLPVVNINVPIVAFYAVMPWGLFIIHFYLLIQASFLADKVRLYLQELEEPGFKDPGKARKLLFPVSLVYVLTGVKRQRILVRLIIVISLIIFPIVVLIVTQIRFLPYQSEVITWQHRIIIVLDIGLLWYFLTRQIFPPENNELKNNWFLTAFIARPFILIFSLVWTVITIIFIVIYADFPSSKWYSSETSKFHKYMKNADWIQNIGASKMMLSHFELSGYKLVKRKPSLEILAAYELEAPARLLDEKLHEEASTRPGLATWCDYAEPLDLTARNFRTANLRKAILCGADLSEADLRGANLIEANLIGAKLERAKLERANLTDVDPWKANLTNADLREADFTDAELFKVNLTDADLRRANLTDADLSEADLTDADLRRANLTDADLSEADLTDADLSEADLRRANLLVADLTNADLRETNLTDADLGRATLTDADLREAAFRGAYLEAANLTDADLTDADLRWAVLRWANLRRATLSDAILWGAHLTGTNFTSATVVGMQIDHSWVWEGSTENKEEYFPVGIPKNWDTTIKPDYLCPSDFNIADHINFADYTSVFGSIHEGKEAELKERIKETLGQKCEPYVDEN